MYKSVVIYLNSKIESQNAKTELVSTFDTIVEKLMNQLRLSGLRFKAEIRTRQFL